MNFTQALSKKQIYSFKGNFNAAMQSLWAAAGLQSQIERANGTLPTSGYDFTFNLGTAFNEANLPNGDHVYDYFKGNILGVRLYTERPLDQPSPLPGVATLHDEMVGTVFALMEERLRPLDPYLPYYQVPFIRPRGTASGLDTRYMIDWTTIQFEVEFAIRPSAWPSS